MALGKTMLMLFRSPTLTGSRPIMAVTSTARRTPVAVVGT